MQPTLQHLVSLARQAGAILRAGYGRQHRIQYKSNLADLVTEIDQQSEAILLEQIRKDFPDHRIMAEESGLLAGKDSHCWYIDPLDGTTNYAHGIPFFAVSIAYAEGGEMKLGVIFDPMRDEMFTAEQGKGAWLNDEPIQVSEITGLEGSVLVTGIPFELQNTARNNINHLAAFSALTQGVRRMGSAALNQAYVACGRMDGYWELRLRPWDVAAGLLLVKEAGGMVTTVQGDGNVLDPPCPILAANAYLHPLMLKVLNQP